LITVQVNLLSLAAVVCVVKHDASKEWKRRRTKGEDPNNSLLQGYNKLTVFSHINPLTQLNKVFHPIMEECHVRHVLLFWQLTRLCCVQIDSQILQTCLFQHRQTGIVPLSGDQTFPGVYVVVPVKHGIHLRTGSRLHSQGLVQCSATTEPKTDQVERIF